MEVKGTKDNEAYTEFRKRIKGLSDKEVRDVAQQYALEHPTLALSRYLFSTYFLLNDSIPQAQITEIFDSLCRACPDDVELSKLSRLVRSHGVLSEGQPLPDFKLMTRPSVFTDEGGNAEIFASLLIVMFLSPQSCSILFLTAVTVSNIITSN